MDDNDRLNTAFKDLRAQGIYARRHLGVRSRQNKAAIAQLPRPAVYTSRAGDLPHPGKVHGPNNIAHHVLVEVLTKPGKDEGSQYDMICDVFNANDLRAVPYPDDDRDAILVLPLPA